MYISGTRMNQWKFTYGACRVGEEGQRGERGVKGTDGSWGWKRGGGEKKEREGEKERGRWK